MPMKVLAIDVGMRTGFAILTEGMHPRSGSHALPGRASEMGPLANYFQNWMKKIVQRESPDIIAFASPFIGRLATPDAIKIIFGLSGIVEMVAYDKKIRCVEWAEGRARRAFLGESNLPAGTKKIKLAIVQACRDRGWSVTDDHAGDALCIAAYTLDRLCPDKAHETQPLFAVKGRHRRGKR